MISKSTTNKKILKASWALIIQNTVCLFSKLLHFPCSKDRRWLVYNKKDTRENVTIFTIIHRDKYKKTKKKVRKKEHKTRKKHEISKNNRDSNLEFNLLTFWLFSFPQISCIEFCALYQINPWQKRCFCFLLYDADKK